MYIMNRSTDNKVLVLDAMHTFCQTDKDKSPFTLLFCWGTPVSCHRISTGVLC